MSSSLQFLPSIGMMGLWALKDPYGALVMPTTQYTCVKIQSLGASVNAGEDPLTNVYLISGATQADFDLDVAADAYLITIQSELGDLVVFPNSALISLPNTDGVLYRNLVLSISLSAISDHTDLTTLQQRVSDLVLNSVGVKSTTYITQVGGVSVLSSDQSAAMESARQLNITDAASPLYQLGVVTTQLTQAQQRIAALEHYIAQHYTGIVI